MPRAAAASSINSDVLSAIRPAVTAIANLIATLVTEQVEIQVRSAGRARGAPKRLVKNRRFGRTEIKKWTADRRARRVPTFVIEATGLDTKKKIVAKYGANATFEKGKPMPKAA
jgi:hypothetical protein